MIDRRILIAAGLAALLPLPAAAGTSRLRVTPDRLFLPASVNGRAVEGLLDSGAEVSVVDAAFAERLGLTHHRTATARGSGAATVQARLVKGVTLNVAGLTLRPKFVAVLDLSDISRRLTRSPINLIVGRELFDAARLRVDIEAATLTVLDRDRREPPGMRLPLTGHRGIEAIPVAIEGRDGMADFDIGNGGRVLIGKAFAARHRLAQGRPTTQIGGGGIGGEAMQTAFTLRHLDIAGVRLTDVPVAIDANETANDANIGLAVLRRFGIVTDFPRRAVWLDPRT